MVPARLAKYFGSARIPWRLVATDDENYLVSNKEGLAVDKCP